MALIKTRGTKIVGLISVVPKFTEDNSSLQNISEYDRSQLILHTGIRYRKKVISKEIGVKELFHNAITRLLERLQWETNSIDILICVTQTPKMSIPSTSCQLHGDLEFSENTLCYDINSGCSGFVYGLQTISTLVSSIEKKNARAILCCGDISSSLIDPADPAVQPIFSDAVSVIALEKNEDLESVTGYYHLQTDGSGQKAIFMSQQKGVPSYMSLNGIDVFNYSVQLVPKNIRALLSFADKSIDFPDLTVLHQANKIINEAIRKSLKLDIEKVPSTLYDYGNTASASIPLTLGKAWNSGFKKSGWVMISGFGVGFSVASAIIQFDPIVCEDPIELEF